MLPSLDNNCLTFRPLSWDDLEAFTDLQSNKNVMRYCGDMRPMTTDECRQDLERILTIYEKENPIQFRIWAVCLKGQNELIGTGALISANDKHELGNRIREKYWNQGLGKEINQGLLKLAFEHYQVDEVWAEVDQRNTASIKILDASLKRIKAYFNEEYQTHDFYYALSKADYEKIRY